MKTIKYLSIVFFFLVGFVSGCEFHIFLKENQEDKLDKEFKNSRSMNDFGIPTSELKKEVIQSGNIEAYIKLDIESMNDEFYPEELLFYSLIMANKYHYAPANNDVFRCLTTIYNNDTSIGNIDTITMNLALQYFERGKVER
ncbi:hypothetical protein FACS189429_1810 [Bacteroidia bacterium]|nr:hypothetical protein FACS189429_1810 [Bacteroidia bacterium]GHV44116.1 hypothetical protein FACS1894180_5050 [Bacteroidia bacterium]